MDSNFNRNSNTDKPLVGIKEKIKNFFRKISNDNDHVSVNRGNQSNETYRSDDLKMY